MSPADCSRRTVSTSGSSAGAVSSAAAATSRVPTWVVRTSRWPALVAVGDEPLCDPSPLDGGGGRPERLFRGCSHQRRHAVMGCCRQSQQNFRHGFRISGQEAAVVHALLQYVRNQRDQHAADPGEDVVVEGDILRSEQRLEQRQRLGRPLHLQPAVVLEKQIQPLEAVERFIGNDRLRLGGCLQRHLFRQCLQGGFLGWEVIIEGAF